MTDGTVRQAREIVAHQEETGELTSEHKAHRIYIRVAEKLEQWERFTKIVRELKSQINLAIAEQAFYQSEELAAEIVKYARLAEWTLQQLVEWVDVFYLFTEVEA